MSTASRHLCALGERDPQVSAVAVRLGTDGGSRSPSATEQLLTNLGIALDAIYNGRSLLEERDPPPSPQGGKQKGAYRRPCGSLSSSSATHRFGDGRLALLPTPLHQECRDCGGLFPYRDEEDQCPDCTTEMLGDDAA